MKEFYKSLGKLPIIRKQIVLYNEEILKTTNSEEDERNRILEIVNQIINEMTTYGVIVSDENDITLIKTTLHVLFLKELSFSKLKK